MYSHKNSQSGLTLIEILIAMALLAFISIAIYQTTVRSVDVNVKLSSESTDLTSIALSIQAIESDLSQVFTPLLTDASRTKVAAGDSDFWSDPVRTDGIRRSKFIGTKEKVTFISNGNRRLEQDSPQSDFLRITWEIERNSQGTYTLYRSTDWDAFRYDNLGDKPTRVALLENLSSATFSYYRLKNKTWETQWESEGTFADTNARYPDLISLKMDTPDPTNPINQMQWQIVIKPNLPLNYQDETTQMQKKLSVGE